MKPLRGLTVVLDAKDRFEIGTAWMKAVVKGLLEKDMVVSNESRSLSEDTAHGLSSLSITSSCDDNSNGVKLSVRIVSHLFCSRRVGAEKGRSWVKQRRKL